MSVTDRTALKALALLGTSLATLLAGAQHASAVTGSPAGAAEAPATELASTLDQWLDPIRGPSGESLGAYAGLYIAGGNLAVSDAMESETDPDRNWAITAVYYTAASGNIPTPAHKVHAQNGRTLRIAIAPNTNASSWHPLLPPPGAISGTTRVWKYSQWTNGSMDNYWRWLANSISTNVPNTALIDFNHEAEGRPASRTQAFSDPQWLEHSPWGDSSRTVAQTQTVLREYADAVRYVIDIFNQEGVDNALFMHTYAALGSNGPSFNPFYQALYPGDDVIDIVAWDPYNALNGEGGWKTPSQTMDRGYDLLRGGLLDASPFYPGTDAKNKPYLLAEYGSGDSSTAGKRAVWMGQISKGFAAHPQIVGGIYFSSGGSSTNPAGGPDIHNKPVDRAAFVAEMSKRGYLVDPA